MIESEAFTKRCPRDLSSTCLGAACMAWRWDTIPNPRHNPHMAQFPIAADPAYIKSTTDGHCGLAHG